MTALLTTSLGATPLIGRGKVRDLYAVGDALLLVATDRISAFDHVLGTGIPGKGKILTQISLFWFDLLKELVPNHLITAEVSEYPEALKPYADQLEGRSMLVKRAKHVSGRVRGARLPGRIGMEGVPGRGNGVRHCSFRADCWKDRNFPRLCLRPLPRARTARTMKIFHLSRRKLCWARRMRPSYGA